MSSTNSQLATAQSQLTSTQAQLTSTKATLTLYQNTWGSVVSSGVGTNWKDDSGKPIVLATNSASTNPTWSQLQSFILSDKTDQNIYKPGYTCGDFAQDLYNNAEKAGIRTAWVYILFSDKTAHACDAFQTSDKGLVFIDDTGLTAGQAGPPNMDKIGNVRLGIDYVPTFLFSSNWTCGNIGKIVDVQIYW